MENSHQKNIFTNNLEDIIKALKNGKVVVFPTDTLYGILADAFNKKAVERVYKIKKRKPDKPYIILIKDISVLEKFNVYLSTEEKKLLQAKGITVILNLKNPTEFEYLHRGLNSLAFRIPKEGVIVNLLNKIPAVIAPSANPENLPPAKNIEEAFKYFKENIDLYFTGDKPKSEKPSTIVKIENGKPIILREGNISEKEIKDIIEHKKN